MAVAKMLVSTSRHSARCSHSRSLRIRLISLSLCLSLEASDACASNQPLCVRTLNSFDTHPRSMKVSLHPNVWKLGNFDGLRVATEDCLRSRRIFKTTSNANTHCYGPVKVDALFSKKMKGRDNSARARKATKVIQAKVTVNKPLRSLQWLRRVRKDARSVPFASSYRLTSSTNSIRRSPTSSILEPHFHVMICTTGPVLPS